MTVNRYTIFLPVKNGGEHLKQCVASILDQSYPYFDLVVLENHSIDGSLVWLRNLEDPRVSVIPSNSDLDIQSNWGRIVNSRKNEFMTMIGHDDVLAPDFLKTVDELIGAHADGNPHSLFAWLARSHLVAQFIYRTFIKRKENREGNGNAYLAVFKK